MDDLAVSIVRCGDPLVRDFEGNRLHRFYHQMKAGEHMQFIGCLMGQTQWAAECIAANISAGKLVSVEPGGQGQISMQHIIGGPFL